MAQKFANAARTTVALTINDTDTTLTVTDGDAFPIANTGSSAISSAADWFKIVLQDEDDNIEVVYVRTHASDSETMSNLLRGQEGTTAREFLAGAIVGLRPTSGDAEVAELVSREAVREGDSRLTDSRAPSGGAGGVLSGSYPNPSFAADMATQAELDAVSATVATKAPLASPAFTGTPTGITKTHVGLGNVDNTSDATVAAAVQTLTNKTISGASNTLTNIAQSSVTGLDSDLDNKLSLDGSETLTNVLKAPGITQAASANLDFTFPNAYRAVLKTANGTQLEIGENLASAVNFLRVSSRPTGIPPVIAAIGADANIDIRFIPKGTGTVNFNTTRASGVATPYFGDDASTKNYADQVKLNAQTGTAYTLVALDAGKTITMSNTSAQTLTVPPNGTVAIAVGTVIHVVQLNTGLTTIAAGSGVTINTADGLKLYKQYGMASLIKTATDTWLAIGTVA